MGFGLVVMCANSPAGRTSSFHASVSLYSWMAISGTVGGYRRGNTSSHHSGAISFEQTERATFATFVVCDGSGGGLFACGSIN
jgi:hypothetical protein